MACEGCAAACDICDTLLPPRFGSPGAQLYIGRSRRCYSIPEVAWHPVKEAKHTATSKTHNPDSGLSSLLVSTNQCAMGIVNGQEEVMLSFQVNQPLEVSKVAVHAEQRVSDD